MTRLRVTLSSSPLDREVAQLVDQAQRSLIAAIERCESASAATPEARRRVALTRRDLKMALGALGSVRRTQPNYDTDDPDLIELPKRREETRQASVDDVSRVIEAKRGND